MGLRESEAKIASLEASLASLESEDILQKEAIVKQIEEIRQTAYTHMDAWDSVYPVSYTHLLCKQLYKKKKRQVIG